jgi:hypothetical protein
MDLHLVVGTHTETVEVSGVGSNVETVNPTLGESVTSRPIVNMPLNGRNVLDLALLQPGVTEDNPDDTGAGHFSVGGGRADSVTFLLDGGLNNDLMGNNVVLNPNPDQQLHSGIWPQRRRCDQCGHQVRHQPVPRQRLRIRPQYRV